MVGRLTMAQRIDMIAAMLARAGPARFLFLTIKMIVETIIRILGR